MNYWETVAGQELLNLIKMEVSRYSARKQYTIKTKLQNSKETLEKELAEGAKYVSSYQYKLGNMEDDDYAIPFNSVMSKEQVDGSYKLFTMSYSDVYKEKGFTMARMDDGSYNIALKGTKTLSFDFQNVDDFINQTKAPEGHTFDEKDYDEVK